MKSYLTIIVLILALLSPINCMTDANNFNFKNWSLFYDNSLSIFKTVNKDKVQLSITKKI